LFVDKLQLQPNFYYYRHTFFVLITQ